MQVLWLTDAQARQIVRHALDDAPREACGIIGGHDGRAETITPVANVADDPLRYYTLDPVALTNTLMALHSQGQSIIGFYHSHPHGDSIPSKTDIAQASYPNTAYVIVGLKDRLTPSLAAWTMDSGNVSRLPLHIGFEPPDVDSGTLSKAQKVAIIVGALLATAVMLMLSLSLLPPAPDIVSALP